MINRDSIRVFNSGYCVQNERLAGGKRWKKIRFPAIFLYFEHSKVGGCLVDTGYSPHFTKATHRFPQRLHRWVTPTIYDELKTPEAILESHGIAADSIKRIFISHFHADHIGGVRGFSQSQFVARQSAWSHLQAHGPLKQVKHGFLKQLLFPEFEDSTEFLRESRWTEMVEFETAEGTVSFAALDYFGDGSLMLVDLPGHAIGHTGFLFRSGGEDGEGKSLFYVVDACWFLQTVREQKRLPRISLNLQFDRVAYLDSQQKLSRLCDHTELTMFACHCPESQALAQNPMPIEL